MQNYQVQLKQPPISHWKNITKKLKFYNPEVTNEDGLEPTLKLNPNL